VILIYIQFQIDRQIFSKEISIFISGRARASYDNITTLWRLNALTARFTAAAQKHLRRPRRIYRIARDSQAGIFDSRESTIALFADESIRAITPHFRPTGFRRSSD
jgi:hypothetical protein